MSRRPGIILDGADLDQVEAVWERERPGRPIPFPAPPAPPVHHPSGGPIARAPRPQSRQLDRDAVRKVLTAVANAAARLGEDEDARHLVVESALEKLLQL